MTAGEEAVELRLCEAARLALRPFVLYRFTPDLACDACVAALAACGGPVSPGDSDCTKEASVVESPGE